MTGEDVRVASLRAEIARDWGAVREHLARALTVEPARGAPEAALIALSLDHAYQAFETILVRIERALALPARSGESWHRALLADAARPLTGARPSVLPQASEGDWEALLGFRHFLRHAYHSPLDPTRLVANRARLERAVAATDPTILALLSSLIVVE